MNNALHLLNTLPAFLAYLGSALGLTTLFCILYTAVTPQAEWKLLREGSLSASLAFGGALLGFVIPLASAIAHSVSLLDMVVWGAVALVVQLLAFFAAWLLIPRLPAKIEGDQRGHATFVAILFVSVGILNAACMVW
jgi:putative membrane protein